MAFEQLDNRNRAIGIAATLGINASLIALLLTMSSGLVPQGLRAPGLTAFDIARPPPPASPPAAEPAAAAPPSRGATTAPSPLNLPRPLPKPTPAQPTVDAGSRSASGAGVAAGSGAGQGGAGSGTAAGAGAGGGAVTPPLHIAGGLSNADYARSGLPRGAHGTVVIGFRVRRDGGVDNCRIVRSSGYSAIDEATCRLVEQRFRFRPAQDSAGRPIDYAENTDFTWRPR